MDQSELDSRPTGKELNAELAEKFMGWRRIQGPRWDYNGLLPEQGEILVPPSWPWEGYQWPPKGIIPFTFFVASEKWSTDLTAAWLVWERLIARTKAQVLDLRYAHGHYCVMEDSGNNMVVIRDSVAPTAPLAICYAALSKTKTAAGD